MLTLIAKDFKLMFQGNSTNKTSKFLSLLFTLIVGVGFIVIEVYLFQAIFNKLKSINQASSSYFSLFLFVVSTALTVFALFTAKKLFFNEEDNTKLQSLPVSNSKVVLSKLFFMFITMYFMNLVFNLPLFITYGVIYRKMIVFYFSSIFYPVILFLFQAGLALMLVYPFKLLLDFLKKHLIIQFVTVFIIAFALSFLYSRALNLFIDLVASNSIDKLFTTTSINNVQTASKFMVPVNFLVEMFVMRSRKGTIASLTICAGVFIVGVSIVVYFYNRFQQSLFNDATGRKKETLKQVSPVKALVKKELVLLFRNSNFVFSFTGLLMVEPFLSYLIIKAMNTIFSSGMMAYYLSVVPNMVSFLDVMIMMLISSIIYQGANAYITNENKNVRLMKSIPVNLFTQLAIKVLIPLSLSLIMLFVSYLLLVITRTIVFITFLYGFIINLLFIVTLSVVSLFEELHIKRNQTKNALLSTLYTYVVPVLYFLAALLFCYFQVNYNVPFLVGVAIVGLSLLPYMIHFKERVNEQFLSLEVSN